MSTLDSIKTPIIAHMLLIGQTKTGKSDYIAQAALDGYTVIYIDKDNGRATLQPRVEGTEAAKRIHYFAPEHMFEFLDMFFNGLVVRYNENTRALLNTSAYADTDKIAEIYPAKIPPAVLMSIDSWTSLAFDLIRMKAEDMGIDLLQAEKYGREIYGSTGFKLTQLAGVIQHAPFNIVVQAHGGIYERKEKPPGRAGAIEEKDMLIRETLAVPLSSSLPHGLTLGKYFNQIGWTSITRANQFDLDFRPRPDRISGGSVQGNGDPRGAYSFKNLFGKNADLSAPIDPESPWITYMTGAEYRERQAQRLANAPRLNAGLLKPAVKKETP
jgi:hypothetical protein